jgi:undecaprenyl-phosphate galactose phosphotransferase/putative colanic acid biosynthesis UDP-glucose lipid carrier transferase
MNIRSSVHGRGAGAISTAQPWRADIPAQYSASSLALGIDAAIIVASSIATGMAFQVAAHGSTGYAGGFAAVGVMVAVLFCGLVRVQTSRDQRAGATRLGRARIAAVSWIVTFLFLVVLAFGMKISAQFSRGAIFSFFAAGMAIVLTSRVATPRLLARWMNSTAYRGLEVLIVAPSQGDAADALIDELAQQGCRNVRILGFDDTGTAVSWITERRRLLQAVFDTARSAAPGEIYVLGGALPFDSVISLMTGLRILPRAVFLVPDERISMLLQNAVRTVGSVTALELQKTPMTRRERFLKRAIDLTVATAALLALSPLLAIIAVAICLDSKGPPLFRQSRLGYRGHPFQIFKFRTMTVQENGDVIAQAARNDVRVTRIGRWLRKSSLDELPQLWNVLRGEMSVVGPRPHAAAHDALYTRLIENYEVRQHVKPGITGWAQVHGLRGETPDLDLMYRRIEMDIWYACNCSPALDVQILFKTVGAVIGQENAF